MQQNENIENFIVDHPWLVLAMVLLIFAGMAQNIVHVRPSVSYQDMLGKDHPKLIDYEYIQSEYTRDDNLLVLIEAVNGSAFNKKTLAAVRGLTDQLWKTPHSIRVDSITNFQHSYAIGDELIVGDLVPGKEEGQREANEVRHIAMHEPLLMHRATNRVGNVVAASVSFSFPNLDASEKLSAYAYVKQIAHEFEANNPELKTYISGLVALDATVMDVSQKETGLFLILVIGAVIILLAIFMRTFTPVIISIVVCLLSIVMALSLSGLMGWKLTPFTASVPMIILIIAVADCVHMITSYLQNLAKNHPKSDALVLAMQANLQPIAITSITTAIGFLSLNFSASDSINALGNEVAFGVMAAFFFSITLLPASLAILPQPKGKHFQPKRLASYSICLSSFVSRNRLLILGLATMTIIGLSLSISKNEINDIIPHYFSKSLDWRQANDFAEREFGGAYTFSWSLKSAQNNGISQPEFLAKAMRFVDWLRAQPDVVYVNSITDTVKRLNKNMHADNSAFYQLPETQALTSQYLLLYEMSLPYGLDLNNQINLNKSSLRIQATFKTLSTKEILAMEQKVNHWLASNLSGVETTGSGVQLMFAHMMSKDVSSMVFGTTIGLAVISFLLILAFRSFQLGLISLAPNLVPALMAFGIWGLSVGQIGLGLAMVSGMTIGIIVDDTVHFLYKYLLARRQQGLPVQQSIEYAYASVGPAIIFTSIVLMAGFLMMTFLADFRVNSDMATMTSLVLAIALVFDLIALPALIMTIEGKEQSSPCNTQPQEV